MFVTLMCGSRRKLQTWMSVACHDSAMGVGYTYGKITFKTFFLKTEV